MVISGEKWMDVYRKTRDELELLLEGFKHANESLNDMPIDVISYNDHNIVKLNEEKNDDNENISEESLEESDINEDKIKPTDDENNIIFY